MISTLATIFAELRRPKVSGWYGWATNQCGHAFAVGWPMGALFALGVEPVEAPVFAAVLYFGAWELGVQHGKRLRDGLTDAAFVFFGAATAVWPPAWGVFAVALAAGTVRRVRNG